MSDAAKLTMPVGSHDHVRGQPGASVTILEYGDFECPQCVDAFSVIRTLEGRFGDHLRFVFRNFPLTNVHRFAQRAAEAVEWAATQGAFWPLHDQLFESKGQLSEDRILGIVKALGLDPAGLEQSRAGSDHLGLRHGRLR